MDELEILHEELKRRIDKLSPSLLVYVLNYYTNSFKTSLYFTANQKSIENKKYNKIYDGEEVKAITLNNGTEFKQILKERIIRILSEKETISKLELKAVVGCLDFINDEYETPDICNLVENFFISRIKLLSSQDFNLILSSLTNTSSCSFNFVKLLQNEYFSRIIREGKLTEKIQFFLMTCWSIIKLNCITEDNLVIFYQIATDYLNRSSFQDKNSLLNCQTILLSCMLTDQKVNTQMSQEDIDFISIGLQDSKDIEIVRFPNKSLENMNYAIASKCIEILNDNIDNIVFDVKSKFSYLLLYKAYLYYIHYFKQNNEHEISKESQVMIDKISEFYKEYNKQFPKQAESLWQSRIKRKMKDCIDKHKIKGVNLKEEACVDEAGVIYADFLISKEEKKKEEKDIICELNGTHHLFTTKRIRIPLDYVNMKLFTQVFNYNYVEINAKINWENLSQREQEKILLKILKGVNE